MVDNLENMKLAVQQMNEEELQRKGDTEELKSTIIENKGKIKVKSKEDKNKMIDKEFSQYRASIPKKFIDILKLKKDEFQAKAILNKKTKSITIEITKI